MIGALTLVLGWYTRNFSLDASADALTLENDQDLEYYHYVRAQFGSDEFLLVTYTPQSDLFGDDVLGDLRALRDQLRALPDIGRVTTILDVPLLNSPPVDLREIKADIRYLADAKTDRQLARKELLTSPLYRNLLLSADATTTAIRIDLKSDANYRTMREQRDVLRKKKQRERLSLAESRQLADVSARYDTRTRELLAEQADDVTAIRGVLDRHRDRAELHLGGLPMIVADSMDYIRSDLLTFGSAVSVFLIVILAVSFHKRRWVVLPLLTCLVTGISMAGLLGWLDWHVTIVSSNFISLVLILCLALDLHIIVRYREIHAKYPDADQFTLVSRTVRRIVEPCLYTALTTMIAFGSLLVSGIRPVIDFGWMMAIGIVIAFALSFTFFPAALMLLKPGEPAPRNNVTAAITGFFARLIHDHDKATLAFVGVLVLFGLSGMSQLTVENRFIDYYRNSTEIYRGMELIDRQLGGTTPLDIVIDAPPAAAAEPELGDDQDGEDEFNDIYADDNDAEAGITSSSYWFNSRHLPLIRQLHNEVDSLHDTGKVLSLATFAQIVEQLDPTIIDDNFALSVTYKRLPDDVREALLSPYLSDDGNQARIGVRVFETDASLHRSELLETIRKTLGGKYDIDESRIHLSGMMVLYNNMLQSLFRSQILTLSAVFVTIMLMFLVLFRSLKTAVISIIPNLCAASIVLGLMGWLGIPLDLMTIIIAAITVGIGVDDTIHYVHRFHREIRRDHDYWGAVFRCHHSIGRAIYYTSVTVMLGFSILVLSQFVPTVHFGTLTGLAMLISLLANMTLLPLLIVKFRIG